MEHYYEISLREDRANADPVWITLVIMAKNYEDAREQAKSHARKGGLTYCTVQRLPRAVGAAKITGKAV